MTRRVVRLGVSLEPELLAHLDRWVERRNSASRSEGLRALLRKELTRERLKDPDSDAVASVTLIYRHDRPHVLRRLTAAEHRWGDHIRFSGHVHLRGGSCLEILALVGRRREVVAAAEDLGGVKGVAFGDFSIGSPAVVGGSTGHRHPHGAGDAAFGRVRARRVRRPRRPRRRAGASAPTAGRRVRRR